eukprot:11675042-Alexandrium_andersonii.AAC.1
MALLGLRIRERWPARAPALLVLLGVVVLVLEEALLAFRPLAPPLRAVPPAILPRPHLRRRAL